MKIERSTDKAATQLRAGDLVAGRIYVEVDEDVPFIYTDEGMAVDLDDGMQWNVDPDHGPFLEINAKVVIE